MAQQLVIRDWRTEVEFDSVTGGILSISDSQFGMWLRAPAGGTLFEMETPRTDDRLIVVATSAQALSAHEFGPQQQSIRLQWATLVGSDGTRFASGAGCTVSLDGSGGIAFEMDVQDVQDLGLEAVAFPHLMGVSSVGSGPLSLLTVNYGAGSRVPLIPRFASTAPYWGTVYPDVASNNLRPEALTNPNAPFALFDGESGGLVLFPQGPTQEMIGWRVSLTPSFLDSLSSSVPADGTITIDAYQVPIVDDHAVALIPMALAPYDGSWENGLAHYSKTQHVAHAPEAKWLSEPRSWQQIQLMSTELDPRYTFEDLEGIFLECNQLGVGAVQVVGWTEGGQDGLVPVHNPSPKLGGLSGLKKALRVARSVDVEPVLYVKYQWVERPGRYWNEFSDSVIIDENGQDYGQPGPVYFTARKRYGIRTPHYVPLCFGVADLRKRIVTEIAQIAEWGASGVLLDESLYHGRALLCFATHHGHVPGVSAYEWDNLLVKEIRAAVATIAPEFVIAGEGAYDAQFGEYDLSYLRSNSPTHLPLGRFLRPSAARVMTALTGLDDRNMVNQALLYNYVLSYEPRNFKGRLEEIAETVAYGQAMDTLRTRFSPWLWNGVFRGREYASVFDGDGVPFPSYTTFSDHNGTTVVAVANFTDSEVVVHVGIPGELDLTSLVVGSESSGTGEVPRIALAARSAALVVPTRCLGTL